MGEGESWQEVVGRILGEEGEREGWMREVEEERKRMWEKGGVGEGTGDWNDDAATSLQAGSVFGHQAHATMEANAWWGINPIAPRHSPPGLPQWKDAIEEVTALFPQMSPKSVMAETLRVLETAGEAERRTQSMKGDLRRQIKVGVNVAKIAVQRLVSEIVKGTRPSDEVRTNNLALEKEVIKLRREVDTLRRERTAMRKQINTLQNTVQEMKDIERERDRGRRFVPSSEEETRDEGSPIRTRGRDRGERPGSVLGPTLWNIGYDKILRLYMPIGCATLCYADDTLVTASADNFEEARVRAEIGTPAVVRAIERLGLKVSIVKTEAIAFMTEDIPRGAVIRIGGTVIPIGSTVRYLGLTLDSRWTFRDHFSALVPKAWGMATSLARLMANMGGPGERRRRTYAAVVMSVLLYGAPILAQTVAEDRGILKAVRKLQRQLALRVIRGYRTISGEAAAIPSGMVPFDLAANRLRQSYIRRRDIIARDGAVSPGASATLLELERRRAIARWHRRIEELPPSGPGAGVREAMGGDLEAWVGRAHGALTYRMTQILTGHGVFGAYLYRIGRMGTPICIFCRAANDTAGHTLLFCPAWAEQRGDLLNIIGVDRTVRAVVRAIVRSPEAWAVFAALCETVMRCGGKVRRRKNATASGSRQPGSKLLGSRLLYPWEYWPLRTGKAPMNSMWEELTEVVHTCK
ncbi:PREDICTED: uncharacterized protein LOC108770518 [Trachymyrmex cornetzi]|uniref:uncharacterized protein LOC108770518 n=1 Tax=Trachymyrmex cornetzi TaxID=471704 RepID=UPI00084EF1DD|nr:PREDICTED: uncharacterized protein LOC108770518 [Trachymyrmex cornetzi]